MAASAIVIYGAIQMFTLRNYPFSYAAAIAAIVGALTWGGGVVSILVMLPAGVWALNVLRKPEVKALFVAAPATPRP